MLTTRRLPAVRRHGRRMPTVHRMWVGLGAALIVASVVLVLLVGDRLGPSVRAGGLEPEAGGDRVATSSSSTAPPVAGGAERVKATPEAVLELLTQLVSWGKTDRHAKSIDGRLYIQTDVDDGRGPGMVRIRVGAPYSSVPGGGTAEPCQRSSDPERTCATLPGGAKVTITQFPERCAQRTNVTVDHPDGTSVHIEIASCREWQGAVEEAGRQVLTVDQAVAVAADARWGQTMDAGLIEAGGQRFPVLPTFRPPQPVGADAPIAGVAGVVVLDVVDPGNDDAGPGTYRYPTAPEFKEGAFDLQRFQVVDAGETVYLSAQLRDLTPTFGSPLGAQLLDIFIRDPAAGAFSTAGPHPRRNFTVARESAWSSRIQVQGFAQPVFVDAGGRSLGAITVTAHGPARTILIGVPKSALGQPTQGWVFSVALHGQEGRTPDQARGFDSTSRRFKFGLCPAGETGEACRVPPGKAPKVMDVLTVGDASQANILDHGGGAVELRGVAVP